jgi:hypothetical protein
VSLVPVRGLTGLMLAALLAILALTGCGAGIAGSWTLERGSLAVGASTSPFPYAYQPAGTPAGGVVIGSASDGYPLTLLGADGSRSQATRTSMRDGALLADVPGGQVRLTLDSQDRLVMVQSENGIPAPGSGVNLGRTPQ